MSFTSTPKMGQGTKLLIEMGVSITDLWRA